MLYWLILFVVSYLTKSLIVGDMSNLNHNLNKVYSALLILAIMVAADSVMYDSKNTALYGLLAIVMLFFIKDQIFIDDDQYLSSMIEYHQQSIDISDKIKDRTQNPVVKDVAAKIITNYKQDINAFKGMIKTYRPILNV